MVNSLTTILLVAGAAISMAHPFGELDSRATSSIPPACVARNPPPPAPVVCSKTGSLSNPVVLRQAPEARGSDACTNVCASESLCRSWSVDGETTNTCVLYTHSLAQQGFVKSATSTTYGDIACVQKPCPACTYNNFQNGDFESGNLDYWACKSSTGGCTTVSPGNGPNSNYAAKITSPPYKTVGTPSPGFVYFTQTVHLCLEQNYTVSFDYAAKGPLPPTGEGPNKFIAFFSGQSLVHLDVTAANVGTYTHFTKNVIMMNNNNGEIYFEYDNYVRGASSSILIDNVSIVVAASGTA